MSRVIPLPRRPDIMVARQTPYGQFWSIKNKEGKRVVNPNARRVTPQNVDDAYMENFGNNKYATVRNVIFDKTGTKKYYPRTKK